MISHVGHHNQPTNPLGCTLNICAHPRKLTLLTSSFGAKISFSPQVGVSFWFELMQGGSICPMPLLQLFSSHTYYVHNAIYWKSLTFISLATWCGTFVQFPPPLKGRWCLHHILCFLCFFHYSRLRTIPLHIPNIFECQFHHSGKPKMEWGILSGIFLVECATIFYLFIYVK
jgi:hypothetical protein